jgi:hypothetical protein
MKYVLTVEVEVKNDELTRDAGPREIEQILIRQIEHGLTHWSLPWILSVNVDRPKERQ